MEEEKNKPKKPFNHVLEIQNGTIDIRDLIKRIDKKIEEKRAHDCSLKAGGFHDHGEAMKEAQNG